VVAEVAEEAAEELPVELFEEFAAGGSVAGSTAVAGGAAGAAPSEFSGPGSCWLCAHSTPGKFNTPAKNNTIPSPRAPRIFNFHSPRF
jgi:hypothetical protein